MHTETFSITCDADMKLGAGDNESNIGMEIEENITTNELDENNQFDANYGVLDDIDEVEESIGNASEEESTGEESISDGQTSEEIEYDDDQEEIISGINSDVESQDSDNQEKINESRTKLKTDDLLKKLQYTRSATNISTVQKLNLKTLPERPREYIALLGPSNFITSGEPAKLEDRDSPDWVPSVNMGYTSIKTQDEQSLKRHVRLVKRQTKRLKMDEAGNTVLNIEPTAGPSTETGNTALHIEPTAGPSTETEGTPELCNEHESHSTANIQTDLTMDHLNKLFEDLNFVNKKMYALEEKLNASDLTEESFKNDSKTLYFTGFPKAEQMFQVFNNVAPTYQLKVFCLRLINLF